ncbi:MAG: hypothetical protein ACYCYO_08285 [Bacilli bacterium]
MQAVAERDLVYTISPPALAGLLKPYRGLPKSHGIVRTRVDERGKIHSRTIRYALVAITDGCHTVNVPVTLLYDLARFLPSDTTATLTGARVPRVEDTLTLTFSYPQGRVTFDHQTPSVTMEIPAIDLRGVRV